ncbi:ribonuclease III [Xylariaceae sp. FL1019]|nr:ribonuclease III [Xylariaceae sp. FL1019]
MAKRSFDDFSVAAAPDVGYRAILDLANDLLKGAQALKDDLELLGKHQKEPETKHIASTLKLHNVQIQPVVQSLSAAENVISSQQIHGEESHKAQKTHHDTTPSDSRSRSLLIPQPSALTNWEPKDIPADGILPPLPQISDPILEKAARTHKARTIANELDYERLEWIGDAYLYLISTSFIYQTFPNLAPGQSSQLRERLVKNDTLADLTVKYAINEHAQFPREFDIHSKHTSGTVASKQSRKKVLGDLFEAYIGASILSSPTGLSQTTAFLKPLMATILKHEILSEHRRNPAPNPYANTHISPHPLPPQAPNPNLTPKVQLSQTIGTKGVKIEYRDEGQPKKDKNTGLPLFTIKAFYTGLGERDLVLGWGSALGKKEAGAKAATMALENKKLMKHLQKLKDDMEEALKRAGTLSHE